LRDPFSGTQIVEAPFGYHLCGNHLGYPNLGTPIRLPTFGSPLVGPPLGDPPCGKSLVDPNSRTHVGGYNLVTSLWDPTWRNLLGATPWGTHLGDPTRAIPLWGPLVEHPLRIPSRGTHWGNSAGLNLLARTPNLGHPGAPLVGPLLDAHIVDHTCGNPLGGPPWFTIIV
jgi:hypothetical protein